MKVTTISTGDDGESHFEDIVVPLESIGTGGWLSKPVETRSLIFRETSSDYKLDYHCAPRRQYVVNLTGSVEIETGPGVKRLLGPGSVLLAEDTTGKGHISRSVGDEKRRCLFITLED